MFEIVVESRFKKDFRKIAREHEGIVAEFKVAVSQLMRDGRVADEYRPHILSNPGGTYTGHVDFHLSDGKVDVLVLYMPHKTNPSIRLVRISSHRDLFEGGLL